MSRKEYLVEADEYLLPVPDDLKKQIISDYLEKYYITSLVLGTFIIGFLLGIIAYAL